MPIFEYNCKDCELTFETLRSTSKTEAEDCPACSSQNTTKLISSFAAIGQSENCADMDRGGCGPGGFT